MKQGDEAMNVLVLKYLYFHKILCMRITTCLVLIVLTLILVLGVALEFKCLNHNH